MNEREQQEHLLEEGKYAATSTNSDSKPVELDFRLASDWLTSQARRIKPFLHNNSRFSPSQLWRREKSATISPTSYLDGLRGFAALLVYFIHHQLWAHQGWDRIIENAYGFEEQYYFAALPYVRTFFSGGHLAVAIFFVISGYVLSARPLRLSHQGDMLKFGDNVSSALFRRWLRLWLPVILTTFVWMLANYFIKDLSLHKPESKFFDELIRWYHEIKAFTFVFREGGEPWFMYNFHVWTIPLEFKGSVAVYAALIAFSRCTKNLRLCLTTGLVFYFLYVADGWYLACFTVGMLLCDLDILAESNRLPRFLHLFDSHRDWLFPALFAIGVYLGGVPAFSPDMHVLRNSPGWRYLSWFKPQAVYHYKNFYLFWAGLFVVSSVPRVPKLKAFFELPFNQYLGRVSYAFYLVHGPILWSIGDRVYAALGWAKNDQLEVIPHWINLLPLPKWGPRGLELSFIVGNIFLLPFTLWVARIVTSLVDDASIRFAKWLYACTLDGSAASSSSNGAGNATGSSRSSSRGSRDGQQKALE